MPANQSKIKLMRDSTAKVAASAKTPVFPDTLHTVRPNQAKPTPNSKPKKRENIFSKSRDVREDRGTREMKSSGNDQSFHAR